MELHRRIRGLVNKMSPSPGKTSPNSHANGTNNQGLSTLIVMIVVLTIIIMFCCFAAPGVRDLCKRYVFRTCVMDDPDQDNVYTRRYGHRDDMYVISETKQKKKQLARQASQPRRQ